MNRRFTIVVTSLAASAALIATGCSSGSGTTSAAGPTTTVTAAPGGNPSSSSPSGGAAPTGASDAACKLVTKDEAAKLVPTVGDPVPGVSGGGGSMCKFSGPKHAEFTIQLENGKQYYVGNLSSSGNIDVPGVGDKAFVTQGGMSFGILKGDKALLITASVGIGATTPPDDAANLATAKALMPVVAGRM